MRTFLVWGVLESAAAATLFLVLAPIADPLGAALYRLTWLAFWVIWARVLFVRVMRRTGRQEGDSFVMGVASVFVSGFAIVAGLFAGVTLFVRFGGRL
jgi:hypothetical protein